MKDIDLDEIDNLLEGRISSINNVFKTNEFKQMVDSWKQQKDSLRESLIEFWNDIDEQTSFVSWWKSLTIQIQSVILMTSVEELKQTLDLYESYADVVCPELSDPNEFLSKPDDNNDDDTPQQDKLIKLLIHSVDSKENDTSVFLGRGKMTLHFSEMEDPAAVIQSMLVVRSYCAGSLGGFESAKGKPSVASSVENQNDKKNVSPKTSSKAEIPQKPKNLKNDFIPSHQVKTTSTNYLVVDDS
eukprot:gene1502-1894_t